MPDRNQNLRLRRRHRRTIGRARYRMDDRRPGKEQQDSKQQPETALPPRVALLHKRSDTVRLPQPPP
jgi:hypothetical protein